MQILLLCNYRPNVGGISGQVDLLRSHLVAEGHDATLLSTRGSFFRRLMLPFIIYRAAKHCDVVHVHCCSNRGFFPAIVAVPPCRMLHKRIVVTYHGGGAEAFFSRHHSLVRNTLSLSHTNIVLNGFLQETFSTHDIPCTVVPNIIEPTPYHPHKRSSLRPRYICTRAHEPLYRVDLVLRAFATVVRSMPQASLILVGDGSCHNALIALASSLGITSNVLFVGRVPNRDVLSWLDQADIFVSAAAQDNMPVSVMEAMQQGLLVLASRVGGVPFLVDDGRTGLLFDSEAQLSALMSDTIERQEHSLNIIEQALCEINNYSWPSIAPLIHRAYGLPA